jgi:broad-specificity NMP kinase
VIKAETFDKRDQVIKVDTGEETKEEAPENEGEA